MSNPTLARLLTLGGAVPFWLGAGLMLFGWAEAGHIVLVYAAVIASFVAGIHWGLAFGPAADHSRLLLVASNVVALGAWGAALLPNRAGFLVLAALFAGLLLVERRLGTIWPDWFGRLRLAATVLVCAALVLLAVLSN